jgi:hypothetical protein
VSHICIQLRCVLVFGALCTVTPRAREPASPFSFKDEPACVPPVYELRYDESTRELYRDP